MNLNRYPDLYAAGRALAPALARYKDPQTLVLAVALAGAPVAIEVAEFLNSQLDLIFIRRLLVGDQTGLLLCAVNIAGTTVLDDGIDFADAPRTPKDELYWNRTRLISADRAGS